MKNSSESITLCNGPFSGVAKSNWTHWRGRYHGDGFASRRPIRDVLSVALAAFGTTNLVASTRGALQARGGIRSSICHIRRRSLDRSPRPASNRSAMADRFNGSVEAVSDGTTRFAFIRLLSALAMAAWCNPR